ncbi:MAG: tetratricopeptide repeat protein [Pseudomonadota bacterium]
MHAISLQSLFSAAFLALALAGAVQAAGIESTPAQNAQVDDFTAGKNAIDAKQWDQAVASFSKVVAQNPKNADAYNYLGYSNRWLGKYDEAFAAYGKALELDPKHKGALQYSGIAYVKTGQKAQAQVQLAQLQALCASCSETVDLAKAIAAVR